MSIFKFPELVGLVCSFAEPKDCTRILLTNQASFKAAVPFVWHTINGAEILLLLLPNVVAVRKRGILVGLQVSYSLDTKRFSIYARHVKHINVYGKKSQYFSVSGWCYLLDMRHLYLPNLLTLTLKTSKGTRTNEHFFWITVFASRSLLEVQMIPDDLNSGQLPWITWNTASITLYILLARSPNIRKLALHPDLSARADRRVDTELCMVKLLCPGSYEEYIDRFVHLRELSTTTAFTTRLGLQGIGRLPYLEKLSIHNSTDMVGFAGDDLGEEFFPSLINLSLHLPDPDEVVRVLKIKAVVRRLKSLTIKFFIDEMLVEENGEDDWLCEQLFPCLDYMPNLECLSLDVDMADRRPDVFDMARFEELKEYTSRLRLQSLSIRSIGIESEFYDSHLNDVWPWLTHLRLPHQTADVDILTSLSSLPNLQYLLIQLDLGEVDISLNRSNSPGRSLHTIECSEGTRIECEPDKLNVHASFLVSLWPNIQHMIWRNDQSEAEATYIGFLNRHFMVVRAMQNVRVQVADIFGEDGANFLVPDISLLKYESPKDVAEST